MIRPSHAEPASHRERRLPVRPLRRLAAFVVALCLVGPVAAAPAQTGSIVIGDPGQTATQEQSTSVESTQEATGSVTLGDGAQSNDQQAETNQNITQEQVGTFVVLNGALHQNASQSANTELENEQLMGGLVIGDSTQSNVQHATTNQNINQLMDGTFIVLGDSIPVDQRLVGAVNSLNGCAVCANAMADGPVLAGGDLSTSRTSVNGTYIVFGDFTQSASQDASTREVNEQARTGSIVLGDTAQSNNQQAETNQNIDQSLTGTYIVFGTLEQNADQNADTVLINQQEQGTSGAG